MAFFSYSSSKDHQHTPELLVAPYPSPHPTRRHHRHIAPTPIRSVLFDGVFELAMLRHRLARLGVDRRAAFPPSESTARRPVPMHLFVGRHMLVPSVFRELRSLHYRIEWSASGFPAVQVSASKGQDQSVSRQPGLASANPVRLDGLVSEYSRARL